MKVVCIGSGSSGNCFYAESYKGTGIFLDAGCRYSDISKHDLRVAGKCVLVTHEHGDHAKYARDLQQKYGATILGSNGTLDAIGVDRAIDSACNLDNIYIEDIDVVHNAADPCAYYIELDDESVLYIVDAGQVPYMPDLRPDVLICEANYTPKRMAANADKSDSALYVSGRVSSGVGHLSIHDAVEIATPMLPTLELLIFCHISKNNFDVDEYLNDPTISQKIKAKAHLAKAGDSWDTIPF